MHTPSVAVGLDDFRLVEGWIAATGAQYRFGLPPGVCGWQRRDGSRWRPVRETAVQRSLQEYLRRQQQPEDRLAGVLRLAQMALLTTWAAGYAA